MGYYVQYGAGLCAPPNWQNFDISPTLRLQRLPIIGKIIKESGVGPDWPSNVEYGNIIEGLPIEPNSCDGVYCSHVLEHLALEDVRKALKKSYKYLRSGGIFRLVVPDLERMVEEYIASQDPEAAINFVEYTLLGTQKRSTGIQSIIKTLWGNIGHLWMWDYKAMKYELEKVGFKEIRRANFGDSSDVNFSAVEQEERWLNELGIECKK